MDAERSGKLKPGQAVEATSGNSVIFFLKKILSPWYIVTGCPFVKTMVEKFQ
jgi:hypothetical protein